MPTLDYHLDLKKRLARREFASAYLETAFQESCRDGDWAAFGLALRQVIEARDLDLTQFSKAAGVNRQHLYLLFGSKANPTLHTLVPILTQLDLTLSLRPRPKLRPKPSPALA